jgi:hypothetical protein
MENRNYKIMEFCKNLAAGCGGEELYYYSVNI